MKEEILDSKDIDCFNPGVRLHCLVHRQFKIALNCASHWEYGHLRTVVQHLDELNVVHGERHVEARHRCEDLQRGNHLPQLLHGNAEEETSEDAAVDHCLDEFARVRAYIAELLVFLRVKHKTSLTFSSQHLWHYLFDRVAIFYHVRAV